MNEETISFVNEDGTLKSKEEVLNSISTIYDDVAEKMNGDLLDELVNPENHVDIEQTIGTFDFYERHLYLTEEITQLMANQFSELIYFWNNIDNLDNIPIDERVPIKIFINSPGGDLDAVFSIISAMRISTTPIHTIVTGTSYSGGFFIGICGNKRFAYPYSTFLFHEGSSADMGDAHKFFQRVDFYKTQLNSLKKITLANTNISGKTYDEHFKDDWCFGSEEALNLGVIDYIVNNFDDMQSIMNGSEDKKDEEDKEPQIKIPKVETDYYENE